MTKANAQAFNMKDREISPHIIRNPVLKLRGSRRSVG